MSFLHPLFLWLLLLPAALAGGALLLHLHRRQEWRQLVSPRHPELVQQNPLWRTLLPQLLALGALTLGILALARPINGYTESAGFTSGRNLIIALDISRSMETRDVSPSRLEEARAAAYELIEALPGDKIGLIVFAGEADLVVPLTYDHTALRDALEQVNRDWTGYGGTNFGMVLNKAMGDFERSAPQGTNALVILSDGEDTVDTSLELAEAARNKHMLVITVGIGTAAGGPIPDPQGENGLWQDASGKHVVSKLDIERLQRFADATGGSCFTMGSGADLTAFAREAVAQLDRHEEAFSANKVPRDLYAWAVGASLLLLVAAILLGTQWRQPRRILPLLLLLALTAPSQAAERQHAEAYAAALQHAQEQHGQAAREQLSQALLDEDTRLQSAALFALGNLNAGETLQRLRQLYAPPAAEEEEGDGAAAPASPTPEQLQSVVDALERDITPYQDALGILPDFPACQANQQRIRQLIETLKEEIERLKQQQQQDKPDQQQNQQQQDKPDQQQNQQQQDKPDQQQDQQQQDKPDQQQDQQQQDKPDQQQDQQQQDKPDQQQDQQQNESDQQQDQQQDKPDQQQDQQQQDKPDQQQDQPQQDKPDQQQGNQQPSAAAPAPPPSETDKAKQRAASILQMHMDEEKGSPIPHFNNHMRPPSKDY